VRYVLSSELELQVELLQNQMTYKPIMRLEVYACALRASQNRKEGDVQRPGGVVLPPPSELETEPGVASSRRQRASKQKRVQSGF
jgi:hypothetical protein